MNIREFNALMIKNDANNRLSKGKLCHSEGLVIEVKSKVDSQYDSLDIYGKVMSQNDIGVYDTNISIDLKNQALIYTECQCLDFKGNIDFNSNYICKHTAATFFRFIELLERKIREESEQNNKLNKESEFRKVEIDYADVLLKELEKANNNEIEKINLEINLSRKSYFRGNEFYEADFRIGNKKTYVLKSIAEFIDARSLGKKLTYGKGFTFNPEIHYFSYEDERIIDFMEEYAGLNEALENSFTIHRHSSNSIAKNKTLLIPQQALRRFLTCAKHKVINFDDKDATYNVIVREDELPISFSLENGKEGIQLSMDRDTPEPITLKGDVFIYKNIFYLPPKDQVNKYKSFYSVLLEKNVLVFKGNKKQEVFNKVIPILDSISTNIKIDKELQKNVIKEELKAEVFFDRDKQKTWANILLNYGKSSFDFFKGPNKDQIIIRDLKKESLIEESLKRLNFFRDKGRFIFNGDDEELYKFLSSDLDQIRELGEIYYSDRFKERKIYGSSSIKASIKEGRGNYLDFAFQMEDINHKEVNSIMGAIREKRKFFKLKNSSFVDLQDSKVVEFFNLLDNLSADNNIKGNTLRIHRNRSMYINDAIGDGDMAFIEGKGIVSHISNKMRSIDDVSYEVPKELNATLRDYQLTGFKWFKVLAYYEFGGILADEMGLGKTLQTIAFLLSEKGKKSIVITPTSLIYNWKSEFDSFAPTLNIVILHGTKDERTSILNNLDQYDVILTTYGTLRNDFELYDKMVFDYCIIDEGQNIKNPLSQSSEAVKDVNAKVKFALTGTPIENNLIELWSLFDYIMPGYLFGKTKFQEKFTGKDGSIKNLKKLIQPFILRRLKREVMLELPSKIEKKFFVDMKDEQKVIYATFIDEIKKSMDNKEFAKDKITVFSYLTRLRQLCLDPSIIVDNYHGGSAKIDMAVDLIEESINDGHKILLFSQFTSVLDSLKRVLDEKEIEYFYLDGSTKAIDRIKMVNSFNEGNRKSIFLISLKAGGTGLNLTSADIVIHFDPWWNPAIEDQATDRAHRFGQKNVVEVVKLIAKGTIEEKILKLQESKKEMINQVMSGNYKNGSLLSELNEDDIRELFTY